jgi:hypothetical protein
MPEIGSRFSGMLSVDPTGFFKLTESTYNIKKNGIRIVCTIRKYKNV